MTFPSTNESETPAKYKYRFESKLKSFDLDIPPQNWEENGFKIMKSLKSGGASAVLSLDKFIFVAEAATHLKELYRLDFVSAKCTVREYEFINSDYDYRENPTSYELDFETYETVKVDDYAFGVSIQGNKSSTVLTFANRKATKINLNSLKSIGNYSIVDFAGLKTSLWFDPISALSRATLAGLTSDIGGTFGKTLSISTITDGDYSELQEVTGGLETSKANSFFFESEKDRTINVTGTVEINVAIYNPPAKTIGIGVAVFDSSGTFVSSTVIDTEILVSATGAYTITLDGSFDILTGESACMVAASDEEVDTIGTVTSFLISINSANVTTGQSLIDGWPITEASMRVCQHVFDKQYAYYSDKFSRTGLVYNYDGDAYLSEDQLTFAHLCTGLDMRYIDYDEPNNPHNMSFEDLFDTKQVLFNTGYGIETIDGVEMIREEDYSYFFNDTIILDLSDRINELDITERVLSEECFSKIAYGYKKSNNDVKFGRGEYNVDATRSTILNTDKTFESISQFRGDTSEIAANLSNSAGIDGSTDRESDNEIFIIKTQISEFAPTIEWKAETDENITVLNNSSGFVTGGLNYYFTPLRSLIRRASRFTGCLYRALSSEILMRTSSKNQTLETSGEGYTVIENDDLSVSATYLDSSLFLPIINTVEVEFTSADLKILNATGVDGVPNMYKKLKFTDDKIGWIYPEIVKKNGEIKAVINIIRQNA